MTNMIDEMDQVSEALKAAGDDIAARTLHNARRDRIRGLVTPAAADAALSAGKRRLAELVTPKRPLESIFDMLRVDGVVVPASQLPGPRPLGQGFVFRQGDEVRREAPPADPGVDVRSESSAFAERREPSTWRSPQCDTCGHLPSEHLVSFADHPDPCRRRDCSCPDYAIVPEATPVDDRDALTHYDRIVSEIWAWLNRHDAPWSPSDAKVADLARHIEDLTP